MVTRKSSWVHSEKFGCMWRVVHFSSLVMPGEKYLEYAPIDIRGIPIWDEVGEVTNVDGNQDMVDEINKLLDTDFQLSEFAGR